MKILREIGKMRIYWEIYECAVNMSRMENLQELDKSLEKKKDRREYRILRKEIKEEKLRSCKVERFF